MEHSVSSLTLYKKGQLMAFFCGADRDRTDDLLNAIQALSHLSYSPKSTANISGLEYQCQ